MTIAICTIFYYLHAEEDCVSREEFESLQKELNYWQNTTINILQKYLIDNDSELAIMQLKIQKHHVFFHVHACATKKLQATVLKLKTSTSRRS